MLGRIYYVFFPHTIPDLYNLKLREKCLHIQKNVCNFLTCYIPQDFQRLLWITTFFVECKNTHMGQRLKTTRIITHVLLYSHQQSFQKCGWLSCVQRIQEKSSKLLVFLKFEKFLFLAYKYIKLLLPFQKILHSVPA